MRRHWSQHRLRRAKLRAGLVALFVLFSVCVTWPVAKSFSTQLAIGVEPAPTVPLFNWWTLWWNCDRLNHAIFDQAILGNSPSANDSTGYWDAPIFYPEKGAFAFSEPQPLSGLAAWLLSFVLPSLTAGYHTILFINLALNGWTTARLLSRLRVGRYATGLGGCCVAVLPLIHWQLGVLQLTALWPVIWTVGSLRAAMQRPSWRGGAVLGLALATTYLMCHYYALMLGTLLVGTAWVFVRPSIVVPQFRAMAIGVTVAALVVMPFAWTELRILKAQQLGHSREFVDVLSLTPQAYAQTPWPQWLNAPLFKSAADGSHWGASPGSIKALLALVGIAWGMYRRPLRRWTIFLLVWLSLAFVLSLGIRFKIGDVVPFDWLIRYVPGYTYFRSPFRFALFVQFAAAMLAALGIDGIAQAVFRLGMYVRGNPLSKKRWHIVRTAVAMIIGMCAVAEAWPPPSQRFPMPDDQQPPAWARWLDESTPRDAIVAFVPFPNGSLSTHYQPTVEWMCWQRVHHRRMVNGYSGLFPKSYLDLNQRMASFPSPQSIESLRIHQVDYCVITGPLNDQLKNNVNSSLELVFADNPNATAIYRLKDRTERTGTPAGTVD